MCLPFNTSEWAWRPNELLAQTAPVMWCSQNQPSSAENLEVFEALKDDEELKHVFEDMQKRGPQALQQ